MSVRQIILLGVGLCCLMGSRSAYGQTANDGAYTLVLRGVAMNQALEELVRLTQIDLVYNSDLVVGKHVYCAGRDLSAEALLRCVLARSGLDYVRSSAGTYILIEGLEGPPRYGDLAGSIVDQVTGEPLPYANVLLADASAGTTTDKAGLFSFSSVLSGMHRLVVTYVGYEAAVDSVWVGAGDAKRLEIALRPKELTMVPIVINGLVQRLPSSELGTGTLASHQLEAFHGAGTPDVARGVSGLPGIAVHQPLADLHIQGGASGEHLTLLDGVPVRDPVSLGRHLSAFSPLALDRLTVHKAGFGAEHGSHLSGVIAVEQDVTGAQRQGVVFSVDPVSFNGKLQGRFALPGERQGAAMLAVRTSVWDVYQDPGVASLLRHWDSVDPLFASIWLQEEVNTSSLGVHRPQPSVAFSDAHAAVRLHLSPFRTLYASAYRAGNHIASELLAVNSDNPDNLDRLILTRDDYDWTNWASQVRHSWLIGARSIGTLEVQGSWHRSQYTYHALQDSTEPLVTPEDVEQALATYQQVLDTKTPGSDERNRIREVSLKAELSHSFSRRYHVETGLAATHVDSQFLLGNQFIAPITHEAATWQLAGFGKGALAFGLETTREPSLRLTYLPTRRTVYAEPRLALRYDRAASRIGPYALRLAGGLYHQFINQFELSSSGATAVVPAVLFWLPITSSLAPPRVYHLAAEVLLMPRTGWTISVEGYYKGQPRLLVLDYSALMAEHAAVLPLPPPELQQAAFISPTRGRAYGGSARVERSGERLSTTVTYSFSRAQRRYPGRFVGRMEPVPWNVPHRLDLDANVALTTALALDLNWRGAWGRRWALRRAYYDYLALRLLSVSLEPFDLNQPSDLVIPPYYRLDAGLTYEQTWGRATIQVQAFVVNVLGRNNVYDWSLQQNEEGIDRVARTLPGRHPVFSVRFNY